MSRAPDQDDRRASRLHLTPDGRRAASAGSATSEQWLERSFGEALGVPATTRLAGLAGTIRTQTLDGPVGMNARPESMRAVVLRGPGGIDALELQRLPVPTPRPGWVLIRVRAFGLNRSSCTPGWGLRRA